MATTTQRMKSILMMNLAGMCTSIGTMRPTLKISKKILTRSQKTNIGKMDGKAKLRFWHLLWKSPVALTASYVPILVHMQR